MKNFQNRLKWINVKITRIYKDRTYGKKLFTFGPFKKAQLFLCVHWEFTDKITFFLEELARVTTFFSLSGYILFLASVLYQQQ